MVQRKPSLPSDHFIAQYFQSFAEDPIAKFYSEENGDSAETGDNGHSERYVSTLKRKMDTINDD